MNEIGGSGWVKGGRVAICGVYGGDGGGNTSGRFAGMDYGTGRQIQPLVCHRPGRWDAGWSGVRPVCGINQLHDVIQWRLRSGFIEHRNGKMPLGDLSGMG